MKTLSLFFLIFSLISQVNAEIFIKNHNKDILSYSKKLYKRNDMVVMNILISLDKTEKKYKSIWKCYKNQKKQQFPGSGKDWKLLCLVGDKISETIKVPKESVRFLTHRIDIKNGQIITYKNQIFMVKTELDLSKTTPLAFYKFVKIGDLSINSPVQQKGFQPFKTTKKNQKSKKNV